MQGGPKQHLKHCAKCPPQSSHFDNWARGGGAMLFGKKHPTSCHVALWNHLTATAASRGMLVSVGTHWKPSLPGLGSSDLNFPPRGDPD